MLTRRKVSRILNGAYEFTYFEWSLRIEFEICLGKRQGD